MKYLIIILSIALLFYGAILTYVSLWYGDTFYALSTVAILTGLLFLLFDQSTGKKILLLTSIAFLLKSFERAAFLILYDFQNLQRWTVIGITILLSVLLLFAIYRAKGYFFKLPSAPLLTLSLFALAMLSFISKPHINEYNCWYYFDKGAKEYNISFAVSPEHIFEVTSHSNEMRNFVENYGIKDENREGIYCPNTKVRITTRFKKIVAVEVVGFTNTITDNIYKLPHPISLEMNSIKGDMTILEPEFFW